MLGLACPPNQIDGISRIGHTQSFGGKYLELIFNERICHTDQFADSTLPGDMRTTVSLTAVSGGTELSILQEGLPAAIPTEVCYLGWQEFLTLLARLVEAEIPARAWGLAVWSS